MTPEMSGMKRGSLGSCNSLQVARAFGVTVPTHSPCSPKGQGEDMFGGASPTLEFWSR